MVTRPALRHSNMPLTRDEAVGFQIDSPSTWSDFHKRVHKLKPQGDYDVRPVFLSVPLPMKLPYCLGKEELPEEHRPSLGSLRGTF